jgi:biofilm PGA synthesis N-glycosyltransferase PgaC
MEVSVGVIAHNEEKNIGRLLDSILNQKLKSVKVTEIIVVSSGSTDKTDEIVTDFSKKNPTIRLIVEPQRTGKIYAINHFLKTAKQDVIVQISGDLLLNDDTLEELCKPLQNPEVGIAGGHPVPQNAKNGFIGFLAHFQWDLHHEVSLIRPKFGEMIAFKKIFRYLPRVSVDEECVASLINYQGLKLCYAPKAIVHNKSPETLSDYVVQRRRNYAGHLLLAQQKKYKASTLHTTTMIRALLRALPRYKNQIGFVFLAVLVESYARLMGMYDFYIKKDEHIKWKIAESAKI